MIRAILFFVKLALLVAVAVWLVEHPGLVRVDWQGYRLETSFGILVLMVAEIGMITPPVGLNLFIISAMSRDVPIRETYKGIVPFIGADLIRITILTAFPIISIFLV